MQFLVIGRPAAGGLRVMDLWSITINLMYSSFRSIKGWCGTAHCWKPP